ncbi:DUF5683 domain-containing protein [Rufibacter roseus]|nr:DUF5683 domain-containing protein [Rufibacter roseus]
MAFLICAFALALGSEVKAQVVTATPDSVLIPTPEVETVERKRFLKDWSPPAKAAFYSAVLPGLGQAYNRSYWKIPLIYATGAVIGYFIYDNNKKYQGFARALELRTDGDPETVDAYVNDPNYGVGLYQDHGTNNLRRGRDFFRKYRDLDIILAFLAYGLNIMEAHVHAHLKAFDVNDDLSLELKPNLIPIAATNSYSPALTLQFNLKR